MKKKVEENKAGDAWLMYIKKFPKLNDWFNELPESTRVWISQQIDIFAGFYSSGDVQTPDALEGLKLHEEVYGKKSSDVK